MPANESGCTCPRCGCQFSFVRDSRVFPVPEQSGEYYRRRRRLCEKCGEKWSTLELSESQLSRMGLQV